GLNWGSLGRGGPADIDRVAQGPSYGLVPEVDIAELPGKFAALEKSGKLGKHRGAGGFRGDDFGADEGFGRDGEFGLPVGVGDFDAGDFAACVDEGEDFAGGAARGDGHAGNGLDRAAHGGAV